MFLPGRSYDEIFIFARVPQGFQATTDLASNGCDAKFAFVSNEVQVRQRTISVEQIVQQQIMLLWIKRIAIGLLILLVSISGTIWLQKIYKVFMGVWFQK